MWREDFASLARPGRNSWKRYLAATIIIGFGVIVAGTAASITVMAIFPDALDPQSPAGVSRTLGGYLLQSISFPFLLLSLLIAVRFIHRRAVRTLFTSYPRLRLSRVTQGFAVYFLLYGAAALVAYLVHPEAYQLTLEPVDWLRMLPVILVFTPIQASAEELLFRGYLLQTAGLFVRKAWIHAFLGGTLFTLPHLMNPEVASGPLVIAFYFGFGALFTLITIMDGGLELALGAHAANNLFAALVLTQADGSLPTIGIWQVETLDPAYALATLAVGAVFFSLLVGRPGLQRLPFGRPRK